MTIWRCMFDGASKYAEVEATHCLRRGGLDCRIAREGRLAALREPATGPIIEGARGHDREGGTE